MLVRAVQNLHEQTRAGQTFDAPNGESAEAENGFA